MAQTKAYTILVKNWALICEWVGHLFNRLVKSWMYVKRKEQGLIMSIFFNEIHYCSLPHNNALVQFSIIEKRTINNFY